MAAHEGRFGTLFGKLAQPLNGMIRLFSPCPNQRIMAFGLQVKNAIDFNQFDRTIFSLHRQSFYNTIYHSEITSTV
jgi:hypothetical protein